MNTDALPVEIVPVVAAGAVALVAVFMPLSWMVAAHRWLHHQLASLRYRLGMKDRGNRQAKIDSRSDTAAGEFARLRVAFRTGHDGPK